MTSKEAPFMLREGDSETGPFVYERLVQRYNKGEIYGDTLAKPWSRAVHWRPLMFYFPELDRATPQDTRRKEKSNEASKAFFRCLRCNVELRVPLQAGCCRCPRCKAGYEIRVVHTVPEVFLIVPQVSESSSETQSAPASRRQMPAAVKSALRVLGLDESSDIETARRSYRKIVQSYHPDKVAHLGSELKHVAEAKTKELNSAISTIESYFKGL